MKKMIQQKREDGLILIPALVIFILLFSAGNLFSQVEINLPPAGYDSYSTNVPHGTTQIVSYYSSTVGINRNTRIYLPPGYSEDSLYNVLYLLHGIGGDVNEWYNNGSPHLILDNLFAKERIAPMILVLPNGRAMEDDSPGSDIFADDKVEGFANFEFELIKDLVPFIDSHYAVIPERESRAIAGLSMGGGQALNFGLAHLDTFAWVGAFSPAPNTKPADQLFPNIELDTVNLSGLWISCGSADGLVWVAENTHNYMVENQVDHDYWIQEGNGHDWSVWKPGLYHFTQRIFGMEPQADTAIQEQPGTEVNLANPENTLGLIYDRAGGRLSIDQDVQINALQIYDTKGCLQISVEKPAANSQDISHLKSGFYFVIVEDSYTTLNGRFYKY